MEHEPGPVDGTHITEAYARMVAREAYFWAWPMVNMYNRRLAADAVAEPCILDGCVPAAPLNRLAMLSDYVDPGSRDAPCPSQDFVYGAGMVALDIGPVVLQVPDFGDRYWLYQIDDIRTDSFARIGAMYDSEPGFYLLVGPDWHGHVPPKIVQVFHARSNTGFVGPRVLQDDNPDDKTDVQWLIRGIDMYPLALFDGKVKRRDWRLLPHVPRPPHRRTNGETRWVFPEIFFDQIASVLEDAHPLRGEYARYAEVLAVVRSAQREPALMDALIDEARKADVDLVAPLAEFHNSGLPLPYHWTTISNGGAFGTDYFTRTAVARSNILVNSPEQARYFYQDLDASGARLNGAKRYTVTFARGDQPPVRGFWSLTLYDKHHYFAPNEIKRFSIGTKNRDLELGTDGSLTIYVQRDAPSDRVRRANWLPAPVDEDFSLFLRAYWPREDILTGHWTPPGVRVQA
jgi:hypothetical protein